ncbi:MULTISPECIES: type VI secretion system protein TssL, long form [Neisseria]|jgi:type VI secretion system ompA/motB family protein|uniref:Type VI secretion system OmpA/MotB family protein n=1 Tax=Neisseria subflava NJ9703 TaxID=546268 RepID=A0A9W5IQM9_NEISU|nr:MULTISPECIES: type VI secretion system protein TssL, long form [Neisseria]EFC52002.1 type VI secretion system OmpA/MotB family protein [Neisseria subflava NJ9703]OFK01720.1 cell envelope biogenesis protein OmpA [Neisseria sp. HMSC067H04]OFK18049.1 cell envelope biogenesis protein OmpA [Neisseria sp. HMSC071A01]OFL33140.1 cell envelope biogenesis protein OmpA [Neisseria sp. HMSC075C12]OFM34383.1 cell envelope biogenesis protein OmpA [Neisseria sp. HMSC058F07]
MNNQNNTANNAVNVYNPLIEAAKPVLILANSMQQTTSQLSTDSLINKFSLLINNFEENAEKNGAKYDAIQAAKYCLCTFVDELAVRAGWADETWSKNSLLVSFYDETWGGERFFEIIQNLKQDSDKNIDLLEFMYLCLQFGYKGKYQVLNNGELEIDKIKRDLLALIHSKRPDQTANLFKHNPIITNNIQRKRRLAIPLWVVGVLGAVALGVGYFTMQWSLGDKFNTASTKVNSLKLPSVITKQQDTQKTVRLRPLLENEIARKLVSVEDFQDRSTVTILGDGLFESGSAQIQDQYYPVLAAVSQALDSVEGQIIVTGYTDNQPIQSLNFPSNWHLSQARADAVKEILLNYVKNGGTRIRSEGRGSTDPVAPNDTLENRAKNRRVEITLFTTETGPKLGSTVEIKNNTSNP